MLFRSSLLSRGYKSGPVGTIFFAGEVPVIIDSDREELVVTCCIAETLQFFADFYVLAERN